MTTGPQTKHVPHERALASPASGSQGGLAGDKLTTTAAEIYYWLLLAYFTRCTGLWRGLLQVYRTLTRSVLYFQSKHDEQRAC